MLAKGEELTNIRFLTQADLRELEMNPKDDDQNSSVVIPSDVAIEDIHNNAQIVPTSNKDFKTIQYSPKVKRDKNFIPRHGTVNS